MGRPLGFCAAQAAALARGEASELGAPAVGPIHSRAPGEGGKDQERWKPLPIIAASVSERLAVQWEALLEKDGIGVLTTKVASGAGGFKPGHLVENMSRPLTRAQTQAFLARLKKVGFWSLPSPVNDQTGTDGSQWIIEGVKEGKYHVVDRWSPNEGAVHELGLHLAIGLAQMNVPKDEIY